MEDLLLSLLQISVIIAEIHIFFIYFPSNLMILRLKYHIVNLLEGLVVNMSA